eukprot:TRINITY_DN1069_c0_g2_i3.p1 TRINITY_DN1069_c0_g2~~TRINITY_DN1069_c0_g2_i3.p1  ORF type:complete len:401 (+),score=64.30 TRINITY_DN1069_c0_g2_i3:573-1775(+)
MLHTDFVIFSFHHSPITSTGTIFIMLITTLIFLPLATPSPLSFLPSLNLSLPASIYQPPPNHHHFLPKHHHHSHQCPSSFEPLLHLLFFSTPCSGEVVDMQEKYFTYTLDSFGEIGFGLPSFTGSNVPYHFDRAQRLMLELFIYPWTKYTRVLNDYEESVNFLNTFFEDVIDKSDGKGTDLLCKFASLRDEKGEKYPKKWLREILINFLIAGRDTTALLLTWSTYLIVSHPRVYFKVKEELSRVLSSDTDPTDEEISQLSYLKHCLKESLRLYPSVPFTGRSAMADDVLPDGTIIKNGDRVVYHQYHLHRNPKYWSDPDEFIPERWEDKDVLKHPLQYTPFHAGRMSCLGQHMAFLEAQTMSALLFHSYDLTLVPNQTIVPFYGIVMPAKNGILFTVKKL